MASLFTHPVIPTALYIATGSSFVNKRILFLGILLSMLPDADVLGYRLGVPYAHVFGHRGLSHSLLFAFCCAALLAALPWASTMRWRIMLFLFLATISHGVLDAMTRGGLGVGFFIPIVNDRYFFAFRPIEVSPLSIRGFISERGWFVFKSELKSLWLPVLGASLCIALIRKSIQFRKKKFS